MLRSVKEIIGYTLMATDGEIGKCNDFLFEDRPWVIRYMVANTGNWLFGRKVLLPLLALEKPDWITKLLHVNLKKSEIENSPPLDKDAPVSREYEKESFLYYGWPSYWEHSAEESQEGESSLRSVNEVVGYCVQTPDGIIASIHDFIVDDGIWAIRYIVVETHDRLGAKKVLLSPEWIDYIDWSNQSVQANLTESLLMKCPDYKTSEPINREYESILHDYFGRPYYWDQVNR